MYVNLCLYLFLINLYSGSSVDCTHMDPHEHWSSKHFSYPKCLSVEFHDIIDKYKYTFILTSSLKNTN